MAENTNPAPAPAPVAPPAATPPPAPTADEKEWEATIDDFSKSNGVVKQEPKKDEPAKPAEEPKTPETPKVDPTDKKPDEEPKPGDGTPPKAGEDKPAGEEEEQLPDTPEIRTQRQRQREIIADEQAMKEDIRKEMFTDTQSELLDADGDPIKNVEDVMKLQNPNTGKPFTQEEATAWLMAATQHLAKQLDTVDAQVESIAQANLDLRDWADSVKAKYGEFIKANPGVWNPIWVEYQKTLEKDGKTNIITKAPVNLERFAEVALAPHIKMAEQMQAQTEEENKKKQDQTRQRTQSDRSDIVAGTKPDTMSQDEKEWDAAAKEHYGDTK